MFNIANITQNLPVYLMRIPVILLALTIHEASHGYIAYKLGDPTARNFGRLTLNPLKHLDPIGTVMMLLFGFGWAKPVPVNARHFKNPRRDMALTALAGPVSNLITAFAGILLYRIAAIPLLPAYINGSTIAYVIMLFLNVFYMLNLSFAIFNLLPIPPLDGSRILFIILPDKLYFGLMKYERYIMIAMMLLLFTGAFSYPLAWLVSVVESGMFKLIDLLPFL